jgi:hypothetical protein
MRIFKYPQYYSIFIFLLQIKNILYGKGTTKILDSNQQKYLISCRTIKTMLFHPYRVNLKFRMSLALDREHT